MMDEEGKNLHWDGWTCPLSVSMILSGNRVLYQAVAYWAMLQDRGVTVSEVSQAFAISTRRASDVLHYIVHEGRFMIESTISVLSTAENRRYKTIRVWQVYPKRFPKMENFSKKITGMNRRRRPAEGEIQRLRTWFISRRQGDSAREFLFSYTEGEE